MPASAVTAASVITAAVPSAATMVPATPTFRTAPAHASTIRVAAPVEARSMPTIEIKAIIASAEDKLGLLDWPEIGRGCTQGR